MNSDELRKKLVAILKELQLDSMGVDTDLHPEDNVEILTNYLHWAEVRIEKLMDSHAKAHTLKVIEKLEQMNGAVIHDCGRRVDGIITKAALEKIKGELK